MNNLEGIINKIEKHIDGKDKIREAALRDARQVIISCRKCIQRIHQNKIKEANELLKKASTTLADLYEVSKPFPDLSNAGFVENAAQEFVEAYCLYNILQGKELPDPDKLQTTYTAYLQGLCDVVGELRRKALDTVLHGEPKQAQQYLVIMEDIYDAILRFDYPSSLIPIKRKQDIARSLIEKTRGELAVASCEQRIEYRTDEFRGLLDEINQDKTKRKRKQKENDLNLDRIL
jgi:translin